MTSGMDKKQFYVSNGLSCSCAIDIAFNMATTTPPVRYQDPEVQKAHTDLYLNSSDRPLYPVLPPGVSQEDFDKAIHELVDVLGSKNVFAGEALQDYIDPYEIEEPGVERKVPGAAVSYDLPRTYAPWS